MSTISRAFFKSYPFIVSRSFHVSHSLRENEFKKFMFKIDGYNKYGLLHDDLFLEYSSIIKEAVSRLPEEERMQRTYRAIRAQQAEINHDILPKEQWTKIEDNHFYLQPYIKEILKEKEEMREWEANH